MKPLTEWQRGLQYFNGCFFLPNSVDGTGAWDKWDPGDGTVSHATVGTAFDTQLKRTIYTNDGTANRALGVRKVNAGDYQFWLGDKRYCGGFYFSTVFRLEAWNGNGTGNDGRIFIGLSADANPCAGSDTLKNLSMGLFHKSTDGPNVLNFVTKNASGDEATGVIADATHGLDGQNNPVLVAGTTFLFEMWHFPNAIDPAAAGAMTGMTVNAKLSRFDTSLYSGGAQVDGYALNRVKKVGWNEVGFSNLHAKPYTTMFAPQIQISNANDTTIGHYAMGVANVYVAPWSGEMD
jgi:hypothetical protein